MNIRDAGMFPEGPLPENIAYPRTDSVMSLLETRCRTYQGFAEIEQARGFLTPTAPLHLPKSQEMVRILLLRGIEEALEANSSGTEDHYLEEMIDALNFWLAILVLDPKLSRGPLADSFIFGWMEATARPTEPVHHRDLVWDVLLTMNGVLEKLRNRPWQRNAQSTYYDGIPEIQEFAKQLGLTMCLVFKRDWEMFVRFYLAKDNVLQFRLRSLY